MSRLPADPAKRLPVDAEAIRALADILLETGLTEIEIAEGDSRIRVKRAPAVVHSAVPQPAAVTVASAAPPPSAVPVEDEDFAKHPGAVKSPMVGVAYLSPEPGAPSFVGVGQTVAAGQTLLLIEAMKTFNQIKAPRAGTLSRILISGGVPVEYGEVLMVID
jgi:acetyl-CoA carboxylase biotin carboxyl carrier protein